MVSTITTSSISIIGSAEFTIYLVVAAMASLLVTLAIKELSAVAAGTHSTWFGRTLNGPVAVLAVVFLIVVIAKIARVLS